jgi:hypothetical protein
MDAAGSPTQRPVEDSITTISNSSRLQQLGGTST